MVLVTEDCDTCQGRGFIKVHCCEWCGSYDVRTCEMCDGTGTDVWDDEYVPTGYAQGIGYSVADFFPLITVRRGGISYAQPLPTPQPRRAPLEDRVDLWGAV